MVEKKLPYSYEENPELFVGNDSKLRAGEEQDRLSNKKAQDEANRMRAQMKMAKGSYMMRTDVPRTPDQNKTMTYYGVPDGGFENKPTPEDFHAAFLAIEELKKTALTEPSSKKFGFLFERSLLKLDRRIGKILSSIFFKPANPVTDPELAFRENKEKERMKIQYNERLAKLKSAAYLLKEFQKHGKQWGREENKRFKVKK